MIRAILCLCLVAFAFGLSTESRAEAAAGHNTARADAQPPPVPALLPMEYSVDLEGDAQDWANSLASTCSFMHDPRISGTGDLAEQGENLYKRSGSNSVSEIELITGANTAWEAEEDFYTHASNTCDDSAANPARTCGHYTQMVWDTTLNVGCATANCEGPDNEQIVVCRYLAQGNFNNQKPYETCDPDPCVGRCGPMTGPEGNACAGASINCGGCDVGNCEEGTCSDVQDCSEATVCPGKCGIVQCGAQPVNCGEDCSEGLQCIGNVCTEVEDCSAVCDGDRCQTVRCGGNDFNCGSCGANQICGTGQVCQDNCVALCAGRCDTITCNGQATPCDTCSSEERCGDDGTCEENCSAEFLCANVACGSVTCGGESIPCPDTCTTGGNECFGNSCQPSCSTICTEDPCGQCRGMPCSTCPPGQRCEGQGICVDPCESCADDPNASCGPPDFTCACNPGYEQAEGCVIRTVPDYAPDFQGEGYAIVDDKLTGTVEESIISSVLSQQISHDDLSARFMIEGVDDLFGLSFRTDGTGNGARWILNNVQGNTAQLYLCFQSTLAEEEQCSSPIDIEVPSAQFEVRASIALANGKLTATIQIDGGRTHSSNFPVEYFPDIGTLAFSLSQGQAMNEFVLVNGAGDFVVSLFPCLDDEQFAELYDRYGGSGEAPSRPVGQNARCAEENDTF